MNVLQAIAKPFLGSGLTVRYPFLGRLFSRLYRLRGTRIVEVPIPLGLKLQMPANDLGIGLVLRTTGQWEPVETAMILESLREGDTFFDIGANVGYYTVLAAAKVGPYGRVVAFEPDERNVELLETNVRLNGFTNVTIVAEAVSDRSGAATLNVSDFDPSRHSIVADQRSGARQQRTVKSTSLDEWCQEHDVLPDVIKVDIEGAEGLFVKGGQRVLSGPRASLVFMEFVPPRIAPSDVAPTDLLRSMQQMGYRIFVIDEDAGEAVPWKNENWEAVANAYRVRNLLLQKSGSIDRPQPLGMNARRDSPAGADIRRT